MRLKPTTLWPALAALVIVVAVVLVRWHRETDPIVAGRPLSHWVDVLEAGVHFGSPEYNRAYTILTETTEKAALQSLILGRLEAAYSPAARFWLNTYISLPAQIRAHLAKPRFGVIEPRTLMLLNDIRPEPSARQQAAIRQMLNYASFYVANQEALSAARRVSLSTATQTVPESVAWLRQQLAGPDPDGPVNACAAIRSQPRFDGWRNHRGAVAGLLADLRTMSTSAANPEGRGTARAALNRLTFELGAADIAATESTSPKPVTPATPAPTGAAPFKP